MRVVHGNPTTSALQCTKDRDREELCKTCRDFEAVFLTMLWREMGKSTNVKLGGWGLIAEQAIGAKWAQTGGIGLAEVMLRQMANDSPK